jgi:hypothetical protein
MSNESTADFNLGQITVNKAASAAIASQLESVNKLEVNLHSNVPQLLQGKTSSVKIAAEKIIVVNDIQLEKIDITCEDLSLDLTQAILGKISFEQPGDFQVKIIFSQSDCDRLLNTEYVRILLQKLPLNIAQQSANFYLEQASCCLSKTGEISLFGTIVLNREQQRKTAQFNISFQLAQDGFQIQFIGGQYLADQTLDLAETVAIMSKVRDLLYLRHFDNADLSLDISKIKVEEQRLIVEGTAQVKRIPDSTSQLVKSLASKINDVDN